MFTCIVNRSSVINLDLFWKQVFSYKINCSNFFQLSVELAKKNEGNHEAGTNVIKLFGAIIYPLWKKASMYLSLKDYSVKSFAAERLQIVQKRGSKLYK